MDIKEKSEFEEILCYLIKNKPKNTKDAKYIFLLNDKAMADAFLKIGVKVVAFGIDFPMEEFTRILNDNLYNSFANEYVYILCLKYRNENESISRFLNSIDCVNYDGWEITYKKEYLSKAEYQEELLDRITSFIIRHEGTVKTKQERKDSIQFQPLRSANSLLKQNIPELKVFVGVGEEVPFLVEGTCLLSAKSKLGKSWLCLQLCDAVSKGADFLGYKTMKCGVLYLDLETKQNLKQKRLKKLISMVGELDDGFCIQDDACLLGQGLEEQIEYYMDQDSSIGIIVIDVFQKVRQQKNVKGDEYENTYKDIGVLNKIADKYHISIILVCHDRKTVDVNDPFSNILGSTALQGATDQMIVMYKERFNDETVKIAVKGRTIDGMPEMKARMENGIWTRESAQDIARKEAEKRNEEYMSSNVRKGVIEILKHKSTWRGKCSAFIADCAMYGIGLEEDAKEVGRFLSVNIGLFKKFDSITLNRMDNGNAGKIYTFTIDTIDTIDGFVPTIDEIPFKTL